MLHPVPVSTRPRLLAKCSIASASSSALLLFLHCTTAMAAPQPSIELKGNYVWTGVSNAGTLGMGGANPPGIRHDPTGTGNFPDSTRDYLTPGSPLESFVVRSTESGLRQNSNAGYASPSIGGTLSNYSGVAYGGTTFDQRAVWTGTYGSFFEVTNDTHFNNSDERITITTTIKALTDLSNLTFLRFIDPDPDNYPGGSAATNNSRGYGDIPAADFVTSSGSINGLVLSLYSNSDVTHNTGITGWTNDAQAYLSGTDLGNGDNTIGLAFDIGSLLSGQTVSFSYYYLFGSNLSQLETLIRDTLSQGNCGNKNASTVVGTACISGGTLTIDQADSPITGIIDLGSTGGAIDTAGKNAVLSGSLTGSTLTKTGEGTLTLTGTNSHTETVVSGGTLSVGSNAALGADGGRITLTSGQLVVTDSFSTDRPLMTDGGALSIAEGQELVASGSIAGPRCLIKQGRGTMNMAGVAVVVAGACVEEGTLKVNGLLTGPVFVETEGLLGGSGVVVGETQVSGTLKPGNSPGTLTFNGSVTLSNSSSFELEIDGTGIANGAGNYDRVIVAGAANKFTADGTLRPILRGITGSANNNFTPTLGQSFRFVEAEGGVAGRFDAIITQPTEGLSAGTRFDATYGANDITLWVTPVSYSAVEGLNRNQAAAGFGVDALRDQSASNADAATVMSGFYPMDKAQIADALTQAGGSIHADAIAANLHGRREFGRVLAARQAAARMDEKPGDWTIWGRALTSFGKTGQGAGAPGFDRKETGALTGADRQWTETLRGGLAVGYLDTSVDGFAGSGNADIDSFQAFAYGRYQTGHYSIDAAIGYGYSRYDTTRSVNLTGVSRSMEGETHGHDVSADLAVSRAVTAGRVTVTPRLGLRYDHIRRAAFTEEQGGALGLVAERADLDALRASLDVTAGGEFKTGSLTVYPQIELGYARDLLEERLESRNGLGGAFFPIRSADDDRDAVRGGASFAVPLAPNTTVSAGYSTEWRNDRFSTHQFNVGLTMRW